MSATHRWIVCLIFSLVIHAQVLGHHFTPPPAQEQGTIHVTLNATGYAATSENTFALHPTLPPLPEEKGDAGADQRKQILNNYLKQVRKEIHSNKFTTITQDRETMIGNVKYRFTINKTGKFTAIRLIQSSGNPTMDTAARQAIAISSHRIERPQCTSTAPITLEITIKYQYGL